MSKMSEFPKFQNSVLYSIIGNVIGNVDERSKKVERLVVRLSLPPSFFFLYSLLRPFPEMFFGNLEVNKFTTYVNFQTYFGNVGNMGIETVI